MAFTPINFIKVALLSLLVVYCYRYMADHTLVTSTRTMNPDMTETITYNINFNNTKVQ